MNKAFIREPDEPDDVHCPGCGAIGLPVGGATLHAQLPADMLDRISQSAFYCGSPRCEVGYFDTASRSVPADQIRHAIYPKREDAPICLCTGLMAEDIVTDKRASDPRRVREILARCRADPGSCASRMPHERTCEAEVQQLYLRNIRK